MNPYDLYLDNLRNNLMIKHSSRVLVIGNAPAKFIQELHDISSLTTVVSSPSRISNGHYDHIVVLAPDSKKFPELRTLISYLNPHGTISLCIANTRGLQSRRNSTPRLSRATDKILFDTYKLQPLFREPLGKLATRNSGRRLSYERFGKYFPSSALYSPYALYIYQMSNSSTLTPYLSRTSLGVRVRRVMGRWKNEFQNHPANDYLNYLIAQIKNWTPFGDLYFRKKIVPLIPISPKTKRKRIVFITGHLAIGGVERVLLNIIKGLPHDEFEVGLVTTEWNSHPWTSEFKKYANHVVHISLILGHSWPPKYVQRYLEEYLVGNPADSILISNSAAGYYVLPKVLKRYDTSRNQCRIFDLLHTHGTPEEKDAFLRISQPFDKYIDRRIVISNYLRDYFCTKYEVPSEKVIVIHNGLEPELLRLSPNKTLGNSFLGVKDNEKAITYLGRLQVDKSPMRLVRLASLLKTELTSNNAFIAVVGEGALRDSLEKEARQLGVLNKQIRFYGATDMPVNVAAVSYFTILTSNLEGLPMSALESMAVGTPVIAPAVGGIPEIIDSPANGLLAEFTIPKDEQQRVLALASSIRYALSLSPAIKEKMNSEARKKIETSFVTMSKHYRKLFDEDATD